MAGYNLPQGILDLIAKHGIALKEKDEVIVIETFIPLNRRYLSSAPLTVTGALSLLTGPCSSRFRTRIRERNKGFGD
jgi:hypothetical protein